MDGSSQSSGGTHACLRVCTRDRCLRKTTSCQSEQRRERTGNLHIHAISAERSHFAAAQACHSLNRSVLALRSAGPPTSTDSVASASPNSRKVCRRGTKGTVRNAFHFRSQTLKTGPPSTFLGSTCRHKAVHCDPNVLSGVPSAGLDNSPSLFFALCSNNNMEEGRPLTPGSIFANGECGTTPKLKGSRRTLSNQPEPAPLWSAEEDAIAIAFGRCSEFESFKFPEVRKLPPTAAVFLLLGASFRFTRLCRAVPVWYRRTAHDARVQVLAQGQLPLRRWLQEQVRWSHCHQNTAPRAPPPWWRSQGPGLGCVGDQRGG